MKIRTILLFLVLVTMACNRNMSSEQIAEEEHIEFVDQSVDEATTITPSNGGYPPPPPPPSPHVEEIFRVVDPAQEPVEWNTESYSHLPENDFKTVMENPLSTFSIDVDKASYSIVRRHLESGRLPPPGATRTEELINYFSYDYPEPTGAHPFSVIGDITECPWNKNSRLLRVALKGKDLEVAHLPNSNFVFLIDVSGSMFAQNKLPLLKKAFRLLVDQMRPEDRVSIVVYAGSSGLVLPPTSGANKATILKAIDQLQAGGSTAGAEGIELAYQQAEEYFIPDGNNRVVIATDGDFNVGLSSEAALVELIEEKREAGIFLSVLGFGAGNYKDSKMEKLADHGNGNYAYIDKLQEARKVLVSEFSGTMFTIAKDVKLQLEFNPAQVTAYRLIGYENRLLAKEDFNDDTKDAGELGAGHTVTALYELIPAGQDLPPYSSVDSLTYQQQVIKPESYKSKEWLTVKLRYKKPDADKSQLMVTKIEEQNFAWRAADEDFRFAASVAAFGQLLRKSKYINGVSYTEIIKWAKSAKGIDDEGYRAEFIQLVELAKVLEVKSYE
jgi:Ca-activated chloride channel family protein